MNYARDTRPGRPLDERMFGNFDLSRLIGYRWQIRASASYDVLPNARMRAASATIDRSFSDRLAMRLGVGRAFGQQPDTTLQGGFTLRTPIGDIALTSEYATRTGEWRAGLRIAFGALFDPGRRRYVATPPGPATSASASFHAFLDADGDGRHSPADEPMQGIGLGGGRSIEKTNAQGRALVTGLGISPTGRLVVESGDTDQLYLVTPPATVTFAPRPVQTLHIPYAMTTAGEVYARIYLRRDGEAIGLSSVRMSLISDDGPPITAITEFDGSIVFSAIPPGTYALNWIKIRPGASACG